MANLEVIALDTVTPQLRAPGVGDGYLFARQAAFTQNVGIGTVNPLNLLHLSQVGNPTLNVESTGGANKATIRLTNTIQSWYLESLPVNGDFLLNSSAAGGDNEFYVQRSTGNIGLGTTTPSAALHIKAGTAAANTAPLKFTPGTNLATPEYGTFEYNGADLFFTRSGTTRETVLTSAAGITQLSTFDAVSPIAQTLQSQGSRTGTDSNVAGASLTIRPGKGTGNATPGPLILQSYVAVASGSGAQTATTTLTLNNGVPVFPSFTVAGLPSAATAGAGARVFVTDSLVSTTIGIGTTVANGGANFVPVYSDGTNWKIG